MRAAWSPAGGGQSRRRHANAGCPGRWCTRRSPGRLIRCWGSRRRWWRTWELMSIAAAGRAGGPILIPASTCSSRTGGTRVSLTCPAIRGCWGRWRAGPLMMPPTGWRRPARRGAMPSRWFTSLSFTIYLLARLAGPALRGRRHYHHEGHQLHHAAQGASLAPPDAVPGRPADAAPAGTGHQPRGAARTPRGAAGLAGSVTGHTQRSRRPQAGAERARARPALPGRR